MMGNILKKGTTIYQCDQPMTDLLLITSGKVTVHYPGGSYLLGKGGVIGICEICSEIHFLSYTVAEDASVLSYSFTDVSVLDSLLQKNPDVARLFVLSACFQIHTLLERCSVSEMDCSNYHQTLLEDYEKYTSLCNRYRISSRSLNNWDEMTTYLGEEAPDLWLGSYYLGMEHIYSGENHRYFTQEPNVSSGFLRKCSLDFRKAYVVLEEQYRYLQQIAGYYFDISGNDLFDCYTSLYYKLGADCSDAKDLTTSINRMIQDYSNKCNISPSLLEHRIQSFQNHVAQLAPGESENVEDTSVILGELTDSLNTILDFIGTDLELSVSFRQHVHTFKHLDDKFSADEECCRLRAELTEEFYTIYNMVFVRSLNMISLPAPIRMFLYFGYVDEELAGINNTLSLYHLLDTITDHSEHGVYTFYDWLLAIFNGKKEPSRNEFDQNYNEYILKQKSSGNISDAELKDLENDPMAKVNYELRNLFPSVNKITNGHISIFCPLFCADSVLKSLEDSYVTVSKISKAFEEIRKIDYTAFYRESFDMENMNVLGKEQLHFEYLPDVILMPNVGIRGSMWQEIEGKRRNSPSRMFFSIFHLEDINLTAIRLTGEFRWELCKRIQGARWNDVGEPSLTSEYFDYIQFYRKNHDLSPEVKEKVRSSLQRAKNSFKEMFVRDYIIWVMFEGKGSPRLNKVSRKILFTYCPFPKDICENLRQNPLYTDLLNYQDTKKAQRLHHLNALIKKLRNGGVRVPDSLEQELSYAEGTIS